MQKPDSIAAAAQSPSSIECGKADNYDDFARLLRRGVGELYEPEMNGTAYLRGYDHDIFVSYAHEERLGEWTVRLHDELRKALNLIFYLKSPDPTFNVWIDEILRKNLPLGEALKAHVEGSALLIVVMSPFYLRSDFCGKEVAWFIAAARSRIDPNSRIFIVHAQATNRTAWPVALADLPGYQFFARHPKSKCRIALGLDRRQGRRGGLQTGALQSRWADQAADR